MKFDKPTCQLSEYAVRLSYDSLTQSTVDSVIMHLLDSIGCALGARSSHPAKVARKIAATATSEFGSSVLGLSTKTIPEYAAFANTVMIRYLDYNDTGIGGHPSDMIPSILALAEPMQASGKDVIKAIHAAYEVVRSLRRAGFFMLRKKHIDQVQSVLGSVVGAGVVLGLNLEQMANAVSLAITPNIPMRVVRTGMLSDWKGCATAHGSMMAVFAARLAQEGLTGPCEPFAGIAGFYDLLDVGPFDMDDIGQKRNGLSAIEATGFKFYPAEYSSQGPLGVILKLREQIKIDEIKKITVSMHWGGWHEIGGGQGDREEKWDPKTRASADHSLPFLIAAALIDGKISNDSFSEERISDPQLRPLMQKIDVLESPEMTREHAGELPKWPSTMEIIFKDGKRIFQHSGIPKGHPLNPLSKEELEEKFMNLSYRVLAKPKSRELLDSIWGLESLADIQTLTGQFRFE
jgi:2-methylcitrate dehydratase